MKAFRSILVGAATAAAFGAPAALAETTLTLVYPFPDQLIYTKLCKELVDKINTAAKGEVKIDVKPFNSIKMFEQPTAVSKVSMTDPLARSHNAIDGSSLPLATVCPSGLIASDQIGYPSHSRDCRRLPFDVFQCRTKPSAPALTSVFPSGPNATAVAASRCARRVRCGLPFARFQSMTSPDSPALARVFPSGLKASALTKL